MKRRGQWLAGLVFKPRLKLYVLLLYVNIGTQFKSWKLGAFVEPGRNLWLSRLKRPEACLSTSVLQIKNMVTSVFWLQEKNQVKLEAGIQSARVTLLNAVEQASVP